MSDRNSLGHKPIGTETIRRHIVVDNINKTVYIAVKETPTGPMAREYNNIKQGRYHEYLPPDLMPTIAQAVSQGYRVEPFIPMGIMNDDFYVLQIVAIHNSPIILPDHVLHK